MFRFHKKYILLIVSMVLTACGQSTEMTSEQEYYEVTYDCERGQPILVHFYKEQELAELIREGQVTELKQEPSASGYYYTNMKVSIRGKGNELTLEIGRMAAITCRAR
ncbi:MliC family protein [Paraglaciecola sp. L3A3]|uniref:MliC family protein n=1 Tax=Paraglaciecola sp. L3A3 TaxID=2686358 RepID=UPI00131B5204|nr:MliC family protein [Paraglaciecola sp. L3A3]